MNTALLALLAFAAPAFAQTAPPAEPAEPAEPVPYAVRFEYVGERPALVVDLGAKPPRLVVGRDGDEVFVRVDARPDTPPRLPAPQPPVEDLRLVTALRRFEVRARVGPALPYEVRRDNGRVSVVFGARADEPIPGQADFLALYKSLFPAESTPVGPGEPAPEPAAEAGEEGLGFGPLRLRPALLVGFIDGETTVGETPRPVRDDYFQIEPRLGASLSARITGTGRLTARYEPIFRRGPVLAAARKVAHEVNVDLYQPVGAALTARGSAHLVWDVLDAAEVDPGREYFFALGRFRRDRYGAGLRFKGGGRLDLDLSGAVHRVRFREPSGFFDYDRRGFAAELGYELTPNLRAGAAYTFDRVPPAPQRREAESRSHGGRLALSGDIAPLLTGELAVGYERRTSPQAGAPGRSFNGLVAMARLTRELSRSSSLSLGGARYTTLSNFEQNAFYVSNQGEAVLTLPLPVTLSLRLGGGLQRNEYRVPSAERGVTRRDDIYGWTAGLGRALTRWSFARADYRWERRNSNFDEFDTDTWTLVIQLGVGWLGAAPRP